MSAPANIPGFFEGTGMPDGGWWEALWSDPLAVLYGVGIKPGMAVVDLCSGDGWFTLQLAKIARHVIAVDIDHVMLANARARVAGPEAANVRFVEANAYDLPLHIHEPVDHVLLANAFHGVPDRPRLAAAVRSILKPGGLFAIVNWHALPREETTVLGEPRGPATSQRMAPEATLAAVIPAGFDLHALTDVGPYHYGAVFVRL
jgi:ubiquinone/menaquinone biosynthesis C-methylase UbiE